MTVITKVVLLVETSHSKLQMCTSVEEKSGDLQRCKIHCLKPSMSAQNLVAIYKVDVKIFHRISANFELLVALEEKSGGHQSRLHPVGTMDLSTKFHGNP